MTIGDVVIIISILCFFFGFLLILLGILGLIDSFDEHPYFDKIMKKYTRHILIGTLLLILGIFGMLWYSNTDGGEYNYPYNREYIYPYNGAVCPICGKELRWFNTVSLGNRGYCCDVCQYYYLHLDRL